MATLIKAIQFSVLVVWVALSWGCSIDIDRSETSDSSEKNRSENLLSESEDPSSDKPYIDETYLELSILNDKELAAGQVADDYADYKIQLRLYDIRCSQSEPGYKKKAAGWVPSEKCLVFVKTIVTSGDGSFKVKDAPYGVYFLDLRIWTPKDKLVAQGSDEVVIVRDALNESKIMVKDEDQQIEDGQPLGKEDEVAISANDSSVAG